jgi:hypothetical protein
MELRKYVPAGTAGKRNCPLWLVRTVRGCAPAFPLLPRTGSRRTTVRAKGRLDECSTATPVTDPAWATAMHARSKNTACILATMTARMPLALMRS